MTDTVNVPLKPTGQMEEQMAFNLSNDFGPDFVRANRGFAMAVIREFIAAAPKVEPAPASDELLEAAEALYVAGYWILPLTAVAGYFTLPLTSESEQEAMWERLKQALAKYKGPQS